MADNGRQPGAVHAASKQRQFCSGLLRAVFARVVHARADSWPTMELEPERQSRLAFFSPSVRIRARLQPSSTVRAYVGRVRWTWTSQKVWAQKFRLPSSQDQRVRTIMYKGTTLMVLENFVLAVHALQSLQHPSVERIIGTCSTALDVFVISPYDNIVPLLPRLDDDPTLSRHKILLDVAGALVYLHSQGIVHGDINAEHVLLTRSNTVLLDGFGPLCRLERTVDDSTLPSWALQEDTPPEHDLDTDSNISDDPTWNAQHEHRVTVEDDGVLDQVTSAQVRGYLRASTTDGDVFAFGFLIVEAFTGLTPWASRNTLRILRMVLKQQEPPHPGRFAEVRGLDRRLWQLALHCWKLGPAPALTINDAADDLSAPRDDILRCPFEWDTESLRTWTSRSAPSLDRQICSVRKIKAGRDVENRAYEITGVRMYRRNVLVNIISPHVCRRGNLKVEHEFLAELLVWSQLRHPNVLPVLGTFIWKVELRRGFVVPRMSGGTCVDYLREHNNPDRLKILSGVANTLYYLHSRLPSVIHGDVQAHSVLVSEDGTAYLGNFDFLPLQRPLSDFDDSDSHAIVRGMRWLAPEPGRLTKRTDTFAFGMFGYEVYSGHVPFPYSRPSEAGRLIWKNERPERPEVESLSDETWELIQRCWRRVPHARPSMARVSQRLRELNTRG